MGEPQRAPCSASALNIPQVCTISPAWPLTACRDPDNKTYSVQLPFKPVQPQGAPPPQPGGPAAPGGPPQLPPPPMMPGFRPGPPPPPMMM